MPDEYEGDDLAAAMDRWKESKEVERMREFVDHPAEYMRENGPREGGYSAREIAEDIGLPGDVEGYEMHGELDPSEYLNVIERLVLPVTSSATDEAREHGSVEGYRSRLERMVLPDDAEIDTDQYDIALERAADDLGKTEIQQRAISVVADKIQDRLQAAEERGEVVQVGEDADGNPRYRAKFEDDE